MSHSIANAPGERSFAHGKNWYKIFWVFFIGCLIGYGCEMVFAYLKNGYWVERTGLIYGPFNQIYGLGAVIFMLSLYHIRRANAGIIFLASAFSGAAFEWVCSWVQEQVFHSVSWEYSDTPANLGGRTNLFFSICWGLMGMIFIRNIYPTLSRVIERIPNRIGKPLTWCLAVFMAFDLLISGLAVARWAERTYGYDVPPTNAVNAFLDKNYPDEFMSATYTSMEFRRPDDPPAEREEQKEQEGQDKAA